MGSGGDMKFKSITLLAIISVLIITFASTSLSLENEGAIPDISVSDAVICREVIDKAPVGTGEIFSNDIEQLACYTRIVGASHDTEVIHNWYFEEKIISTVNLPVRSSNWRTFSSKTIVPRYKGNWKVEVLNEEGQLLKKIYFLIN